MNTAKILAFVIPREKILDLHRHWQIEGGVQLWCMFQKHYNSWTTENHWNYESAYALAIDGELINSQIECLNELMAETGLYLKRQQIRDMLYSDAFIEIMNTNTNYQLYGKFQYINYNKKLIMPRITPVTSSST